MRRATTHAPGKPVRPPVAGAPGPTHDREAAAFWGTHDSGSYGATLPEVRVTVSATLRRRAPARARTKQALTLRLDPVQVAAVKRLARRRAQGQMSPATATRPAERVAVMPAPA